MPIIMTKHTVDGNAGKFKNKGQKASNKTPRSKEKNNKLHPEPFLRKMAEDMFAAGRNTRKRQSRVGYR